MPLRRGIRLLAIRMHHHWAFVNTNSDLSLAHGDRVVLHLLISFLNKLVLSSLLYVFRVLRVYSSRLKLLLLALRDECLEVFEHFLISY